MKKLVLPFLAVFFGLSGMTQGFELTVKIDGYPEDETIRLGRYHGDQTLLVAVDTVIFDKKRGVFVIRRAEPLEGGMYMLVSHENAPAEFIIDKDQRFSIAMKYPEFGADMKFTGSFDNQTSVDFNAKTLPFHQEFTKLRKDYEALDNKESSEAKALAEKIQNALQNIDKIREQFMQDNPKHLMTAVFRAQRDVEVPEAPDDIPENEQNHWRYNYWQNHYFDNMDLSDARLLRTPIYHQRLDNYLEKVLHPHHDSLKLGAERLIEKTKGNEELFRYTLQTIFNKYSRSQIIGYDAIWVYLSEKYYLSGKATWASEASIENIQNAVDKTKPLLIGTVPPEFMNPSMATADAPSNGQRWNSVFESKARYTVVIFWEPTCGHCKTQMPILRELYNTKREELQFEVYAVCRGDIEVCRNYIKTNEIGNWINVSGTASTIKFDEIWDASVSPTIYVLDWEKRIVTKRINPDQIEPFIRTWNATHGGN